MKRNSELDTMLIVHPLGTFDEFELGMGVDLDFESVK